MDPARPSDFWRPTSAGVRQQAIEAAIEAGARASAAGEWAAAAAHYQRALGRAPELMAIWVQLGHALKEQGDAGAAERAYRRALALDASVADTHLQLGHLMKLTARWGEAGDAYARALQLDPELADAIRELDGLAPRLLDRGDRARDAGNWPVAARSYQQALAGRPGLTTIWVQLGHALKEQGEHDAAEAAYRRALALDPLAADSHLQLGHLRKLRRYPADAIAAYAAAVRLDPELAAAREALAAALGYSPPEIARALLDPPATPAAARQAPLTAAERYGALIGDARRQSGTGHDVIWLGVMDWHYRIQRPQHLAARLADAGARILYISLVFEAADARGRFRLIDAPHPGVFEIRMRLAGDASETIYQGLSETALADLQAAFAELALVLGIRAPVVLVEHPAWHRVADAIAGATIVYDCLDLATGFKDAARSVAAAEAALLARADLVVAASQPLADRLASRRSSIVIRNAADVDFFAQGLNDRPAGMPPVIGYFGALADWFAIDWIATAAEARPDWEFRLIGRTDTCDTARAARLANVRLLGERPYRELPLLLREFDVAIIPFKLTELTRCTNPVKLYEYMAAGKAVVAAPMPEVIAATELVYIADDAASFVERIARALAEDSLALRQRRQQWAHGHDWASRAQLLARAIDSARPQ